MIYPSDFPDQRKDFAPECMVFSKLKLLADRYDIFYARRFQGTGHERREYEIDFIIVDPRTSILCLEVKGGLLNYNGLAGAWTQNGKPLERGPDDQALSCAHSLLSRYPSLRRDIAIGWGLCFPDCDLPEGAPLPTHLRRPFVICQSDLPGIDQAIPTIISSIARDFPGKRGLRDGDYLDFKSDLLRGLGFVQRLGSRIRRDEGQFVQLTDEQTRLFESVAVNPRIVISGPAGSGKTIIARQLAKDMARQGRSVLLLCYNRILANHLRYSLKGAEGGDHLDIQTFHSLARRIIDSHDPAWWGAREKGPDFWDLEVPVQLASVPRKAWPTFDALIIDEGQDFRTEWFESLLNMLKPTGSCYVFLDAKQDVFHHFSGLPHESRFFSFKLTRNCRNTKRIVEFLETTIGEPIESFPGSPDGVDVLFRSYRSATDQQTILLRDVRRLLEAEGLSPDQLLILLNTELGKSCLAGVKRIGELPLQSVDRGTLDRGAINYSHIQRFKGLEADVVLIVDIDQLASEQFAMHLYAQASRGRHQLVIYRKATT